jgi:hypothetical protein
MVFMAAGTGLGPVIASAVRDVAGSYQPMLLASIPTFFLSVLAVATTGPYPRPEDVGQGDIFAKGD